MLLLFLLIWRLIRYKVSHQIERFFAHVMLDAFRVDRRRLRVQTQGDQEIIHNFMTHFRLGSQASAFWRQLNGVIGPSGQQSGSLKSLDDSRHGHVGDSEPLRQIGDPANLLGI